ncbi:sugar ABC transporter substrate-binding protein [Neobacillus sp.]|uniref:ABC transporter substrate-binding protein n=1 Tax=Neobacillus sp. TaxID=2675273 RepID=UPI0028A29822|nr:sugar ABC transporter substrate-binding protein [Neobacillus sp.]
MKKNYLLMFLFISVLMFSVACNKDTSQTSGKTDTKDKGPVDLTFMIWGNDQHLAMYQGLLDEYMKTHTNVHVKLQSVPFPDYQQKITVLAAGNQLPDIGWVSERMVPQFEENNLLEDVASIQKDKEWDVKDFIPSTLELFQKDNQLFGIPFSTPPTVMFYNEDLFKKVGEKTPNEYAKEDKWTWEQFEKSAKAISGNGVYGANLFRDWKTWVPLMSRTWSYGGSLFNKDVSKFTLNSGAGEDTLAMIDRMMFKDKSHPKAGEQIGFETGKIGMFTDVYSYVASARGIKDFKWDIAPIPSGPKGSIPMLGQAGISVFKGSKHPNEAKELLKFLTTKEAITQSSTYFVPPRESVLSSDSFANQPNNPSKESIDRAVIEGMKHARLQVGHVKWQEVDNAVLFGLDELFSQQKTPKEILKEVQEKVDPILK